MKTLTEKQERFALAVGGEGKTQADAYRAVYACGDRSGDRIASDAYKLANVPHVAHRIMELQKSRRAQAETQLDMTVKKLLETYIAIAFVDPNELTSMRVGNCRHCNGVGHGFQWKEREYLEAVKAAEDAGKELPEIGGGFGFRRNAPPHPECPECDGEGIPRNVLMDTTMLSPGAKMLYRGVQQTKDGYKILFANQDKALEQIGRILGAYDDKLRLDLKGAVANLKLETKDPQEAAQLYQKMLTAG